MCVCVCGGGGGGGGANTIHKKQKFTGLNIMYRPHQGITNSIANKLFEMNEKAMRYFYSLLPKILC